MKKNQGLSSREKFKKKFNHFIYSIKTMSFVKHILIFYFFITIVGSLLLMIPIMRYKDVAYVDLLFTSASSFSDTGLTTVTTAETFSAYGQAVIAILILLGGVGWFALKMYIFNILFGRPISFNARQTLATERGNTKIGVTRHLIKVSISILFILLFVSAVALSLYFYFAEPDLDPFHSLKPGAASDMIIGESPYMDVTTSLRWGFFHAISGLNNAGFDIIGAHSLQPYYNHFAIQIIFIVLFVIGGIGYPVIYDIYMWFRSKFTGESFKFSLFTKLSCTVYALLTIVGLGTTFALEMSAHEYVGEKFSAPVRPLWQDPNYGDGGHKTMALIFNTMSTRNAGFATIDMKDLSSGTLFLYSFLMFIGSAPSSTAGGIRTTTLGVIMVALWSKLRGKKQVTMFNRAIKPETVSRSFIVVTSALLITLFIMVIGMTSYTEYGGDVSQHQHPFNHIIFEVSSAFGTTGLSTGVTPHLSIATKIGLIWLMFIGQLGVSSSILVWDSKQNKYKKYSYVEEDVTVG